MKIVLPIYEPKLCIVFQEEKEGDSVLLISINHLSNFDRIDFSTALSHT